MKTTPANSEDNPNKQSKETSQENQDRTKLTFTSMSDKPSVTEKIRRFQTMTDVGGEGGHVFGVTINGELGYKGLDTVLHTYHGKMGLTTRPMRSISQK